MLLQKCWISVVCLFLAAKVHQDRLNAGPNFWRHITSPSIRVYSLSIGTGFEILYNLIQFISGVFCGRKYLVTYPSSRRRMLWDLLGPMLVIWAPWLQRIADPSLQWGQVLSCINMYQYVWFIIATIAVVRKHYIALFFSASEDIFAIPMNAFERGPWHDKNRTDAYIVMPPRYNLTFILCNMIYNMG